MMPALSASVAMLAGKSVKLKAGRLFWYAGFWCEAWAVWIFNSSYRCVLFSSLLFTFFLPPPSLYLFSSVIYSPFLFRLGFILPIPTLPILPILFLRVLFFFFTIFFALVFFPYV